MKILALETTEAVATVAALDDGNLLSGFGLDPKKRSAESLAPGIKSLLDGVGWTPSQVDLVAVTIGPGSFTGLRVGVTTAKTFAYCTGADILGIPTLEAIVARAPRHISSVSAAVDAQRGQVVAGSFRRDEAGWFRPIAGAELVDVDVWLGRLAPGSAVTGPILRKIVRRVPDGIDVLEPHRWSPSADVVGRLAARDYAEGRRDDFWRLVPRYSRRSAAEEKSRD
jgi:tRNA threonylcarbamoyladenosine biosynthesis protein TsaB